MFCGLIVINEFCYRFKNSVAYYQLMTLDVPFTDYHYKEKEKNKGHEIDDRSVELNRIAYEKAMAKIKK